MKLKDCKEGFLYQCIDTHPKGIPTQEFPDEILPDDKVPKISFGEVFFCLENTNIRKSIDIESGTLLYNIKILYKDNIRYINFYKGSILNGLANPVRLVDSNYEID